MSLQEQSGNDGSALVSSGEEKADYESDSDGGTSALALRRQVASDVEDDDQEVSVERDGACTDDGDYVEGDQGVHPDADGDQEDEEEEEDYGDTEEISGIILGRRDASEDEDTEENVKHQAARRFSAGGAAGSFRNAPGSNNNEGFEEKQNAEPFVVPTAGAFYMHDDRFRNNGALRPRRSPGGRKLWEAKDEERWVHDRFEELKLNEESFPPQGGRGRRGRGREGRGQGRGRDFGLARGRGGRDNRAAEETLRVPARHVRGRGRGLRRARMDDYEFREAKPAGNRGENRAPSISKATGLQPMGKPEENASKKPTTSSVLNSKSPPFFPTGAVTHNSTGGQPGTSKGLENKMIDRDTTQVGSLVGTPRSRIEKGITRGSPASATRTSSSPGNIVKMVSDSRIGEVDALLHRSLPRGPNMVQQQLLKTGSGSMHPQRPVRTEGNMQHMLEQASLASTSQPVKPTTRGTPSQFMELQQPKQMQTIVQAQVSRAQPVQAQLSASSIPPAGQPAGDSKGASQSPANKVGSIVSGRVPQAAGRGSLVYGGSSLTNGLRSVVQFSGQPQANLGVPTVGVTLPSYSSQPQFGFPNSEVTWIPILAGGGSLGSNYSSSYIAVDGSSPALYYAQQTSHTQQQSQTSAFPVPGREANAGKAATGTSFKPLARSEADEFGQQRRRYSQMTFGEERR